MLNTPLTKSILHTTDKYINSLNKGGIVIVGDLIYELPRTHEDRTNVLTSFSYINIKEKNTIIVKIISIDNVKTANGKLLTKVIIEDKNLFLSESVFFNRKYLSTSLKNYIGKQVIISGKPKYEYGKLSFISPEIETDLTKSNGEIVPVYSDINYIPGTWIASKIHNLKSYFKDIPENLPEVILKKYNFMSRREAYYNLHFPKSQTILEKAKYRIAYEELYDINYKALSKKHLSQNHSNGKSIPIKLNPDKIKTILEDLPFSLTDHQKISLFQILKDMEKPHSMKRLLEGDVGTGKTIVAFISIVHGILETTPHPNPLLGEERELYSIRKIDLKSPGYVFDLAKEFRKNPTDSEKKLWELIRNSKFEDIKFRRQHPIGRYIADFYSEELRTIIELDGKIHDKKNQKEYDEERENLLKNYGFQIIRFKNDDIQKKSDEEIHSLLKSSPLLGRRGARGEVLNKNTSAEVLNKNTKNDVSLEKSRNKIQVSIMAPTEILARQHFDGLESMFLSFGISSELLVGSTTKKQKESIKARLLSGEIDVIIGTHTLIQEDVLFKNLGYVIIDEQHRFGVKQREILESGLGNRSGFIPHNLNMTATPIPRTLALTLYGDQDLSIISQYPAGRKQIHTKVAKNDTQRNQIILFIKEELRKGRQVFWINPLVEESEKMQSESHSDRGHPGVDLANAINTYNFLIEEFDPYEVGLLHGKMKAKEKEEIMSRFSNGEIKILSSTSVVEVGVNVPNATIMCIEGAERFGLSQLHQFRGRVGRGEYQSYCYLFPTSGNSTDRLKAMERTGNGFELAEIDLELRGPGEVYGVRQSGVPEFRVASLTDLELISQIREDIEELVLATKKTA